MEIKNRLYNQARLRHCLCFFFLLLLPVILYAQPTTGYSIKNGRMYVQILKGIKATALDDFLKQYDLEDLDLKKFLAANKADSLLKRGWKIEANNEVGFIISKAFEPFGKTSDQRERLAFEQLAQPVFPAVNNGILYGNNKFKNKASFTVTGSLIRFFLRGNKEATGVMLAGSFNNWVPDQLPMQKTDSGWIREVKLEAGKYWYKFIIDGNWKTDADNAFAENDGRGNTNSVYYKPNFVFTLNGYTSSKKVVLSGSFNNWQTNELLMKKTQDGWMLPLYLARGTHTYKFIVDGVWHYDEANPQKLPNEHGDFNSVLRLGSPHLFSLGGFANAKKVILTGSFNKWREDELYMNKTATGWEVPYTLGPGNYEYKFKVDGKWVSDPANPVSSGYSGNSYLIIEPNYTFRLKGFKDARTILLAGDFNQWDPKAYAMRKEGESWVFPVHLSAGKHLYKIIVDGKWMIDPENKLWEQNEFDTGNSIIWIDP